MSLALAAIMALSVFTTSGGISFADDEVVESEILATDMDAQEMPEDEGSVTEPDEEIEPSDLVGFVDDIMDELIVVLNGVDLSVLTPEEFTEQMLNDDWYTLVTEDEIYQQTGLTKEEMDAVREIILTNSSYGVYTSYEDFVDMIYEKILEREIRDNIELIPEDIPINYSANVPSGIGGNPVGTTTLYTGAEIKYGPDGTGYVTNYMSTSGSPSASNNNAYCVDPRLDTPYNNSTCDMYEVTNEALRKLVYYSTGAPGESDGLDATTNCIREYDVRTDNIILTHIALSKTMLDAGYSQNDDWKYGLDQNWQYAATRYNEHITGLASAPSWFRVFYLVDGNSSRQGVITWVAAGNVSVKKSINSGTPGATPIDVSGLQFKLYKSSNSSNVATCDFNTKVADFTCDSTGNTTITYVNPLYASTSSYNTATLTGLMPGDYVLLEDTGGWVGYSTDDFERISGTQTIKTDFYLESTVSGTVDGSKNMGYDTGMPYTLNYGNNPQFYCTLTIEQNRNNLKKTIYVNNEYTDNKLKLKKSSANPAITVNNNCYDLTGATYAVYDRGSSADIATEGNYTTLPGYIGELVCDANGDTNTISGLESKPYYVKEVKAPKGYALDPDTHECDLADSTQLVNDTYTLRVTDSPELDPVQLALKKNDSNGVPVADAYYQVYFYAGEYGDNVNPATQNVPPTKSWLMKTNSMGQILFDDSCKVSGDAWYIEPLSNQIQFPLGTVTLQEVPPAPNGFLIDDTIHVVKITGEHNGSETVNSYAAPTVIETKSCNIKLVKSSANTGISAGNANYSLKDAEYAVYDDVNLTGYVGSLVTDDNGESNTLTGLDEDKTYYVKEVTAPKGFALNETVYTVTLDDTHIDSTNTYLLSTEEQPKSVSADLLVIKTDSENNEPVADAEYTVRFFAGQYADGVDPATLGATATNTWVVKTDANGKAAVTDKITGGEWYKNSAGNIVFPYGTVTIVETKAPTEYKLNPAVYVRTLTENNPNASVETSNTLVSVDTNDTPRKQSFELIKLQETTDNQTVPLQGAGFSACNVADLQTDANGNYIWDNSKRIALARDGSLEMFTDVNGNAKSADLRYGTYLVRETTVPRNLLPISDFIVVIDDDSTPQQLRYFTDKRFKAYLRIIKKDADTQKPIISDDASFKIWSYDNNRYVKFNAVVGGAIQAVDTFTTVNGAIMTPDVLPAGKYRVEEVEAPYGYVGGSSVDIDITNTGVYETYIDENGQTTNMGVYTVSMENTPYKGRLELTKIGEEYAPDNSGEWVKKDIPLKNVKFDVVAVDDIKTTDGQDILYNAGDVVETIITDADGFAKTSANLPEGSYVVRELTELDDYYKAEDVSFDISFADNVNANYEAVAEVNVINYKKIELGTTAKDSETNDNISKADEQVIITDTVCGKNLIIGRTYTIKGTLMDKTTGELFNDANGNVIKAEKTFMATKGVDYIDNTFPAFDASLLRGKSVVVFEDLYEGDILVASHGELSDEGQTIDFPDIHTTATNEEGTKNFAYTDKNTITLIDTVAYTNLLVGKSYKVNGILIDEATGYPIENLSGMPIVATAEFTSREKDGEAKVEFTVEHASEILGGKTVVVFEDLTYNGVSIAVHADISDKDQTVSFPAIRTTATVDGKKEVKPAKDTKLVDRVAYSNFPTGYTYEVSGIIIDKSTGKELLIDGKTITSKATFTPAADLGDICAGEVYVTYVLDTTGFTNKELVVFEEVRAVSYADGTPIENPEIMVEHKDINDKGQTIKITTYPKTGDNTPIIPAVIVMLVCAGFGVFVIFLKKKRY